jgi:hypothetical protein
MAIHHILMLMNSYKIYIIELALNASSALLRKVYTPKNGFHSFPTIKLTLRHLINF